MATVRRNLLAIVLISASSIAAKAESCHSRDLSDVGHCNGNRYARKVVREQLEGVPPSVVSPPRELDGSLLATQLSGELSDADIYPVLGGDGRDWVLVGYRAVMTSARFKMQRDGYQPSPSLIAILRWTPTPADSETKPGAAVLAMSKRALIPSDREDERAGGEDSLIGPSCVVPRGETEESDPGYYDTYRGFRWLTLSSHHRILTATIDRSEGYAGGGGSFEAELLIDIGEGGVLRPVACYATNSYQMLAGEWNHDGTRQHHEYQSSWKLVVDSRGRQREWPMLRLSPITSNTAGATLVWDSTQKQYVEGRPPR